MRRFMYLYTLIQGVMATTIKIDEETRNELRKFKAEHGVTYAEAIRELLRNSGWGYDAE